MEASKHCVMVHTPNGKRIQLFTEDEINELVSSGRATKLKGSLWEMKEKGPEQKVEKPAPVARTRHDERTRNTHGSKRK
jgi:hypothetical protein